MEEELWLRLDGALEQALNEPMQAYSAAWFVYCDARRRGFRDVMVAADGLLEQLSATMWAPYLES